MTLNTLRDFESAVYRLEQIRLLASMIYDIYLSDTPTQLAEAYYLMENLLDDNCENLNNLVNTEFAEIRKAKELEVVA